MHAISPLEQKRLKYQPVIPTILKKLKEVHFVPCKKEGASPESLKNRFPKTFGQSSYQLKKGKGQGSGALKVGVVFSGGPAAGGHNVIAALFDGLKKVAPKSKLIGFLDGPGGIVQNQWIAIGEGQIKRYRNQGGFDLIGSGRVKIETDEQLRSTLKTMQEHRLDGLVIIGGDDSNTNAAILAEYFLKEGCKTRVIGVPKTIDGDLRSRDIEISFGFDSACKTQCKK